MGTGAERSLREEVRERDPELDLLEMELCLRSIGRESRPEVLDRIDSVSPELGDAMRSLVDALPERAGEVLRDALIQSRDPEGIRVARISYSPRNYREAADAYRLASTLEGVALGSASSAIGEILPPVRALASFLLAVGRRGPGALSCEDGTAVAGDSSLSVSGARDLLRILSSHHPVRGAAAAAPHRARVESARVPSPPDDAPSLLEAGSLLRFSGTSSSPRALPADLAAPLDVDRWALVRSERGASPEDESRHREVCAAALRACSLILQRPFFSSLDDVVFELHPERSAAAWSDPESGVVHSCSGPVELSSLVRELGRLVDERLGRGAGAPGQPRSEQEGSPIASFCVAARPRYVPVAEQRSGAHARAVLDAAVPGLSAEGLVPLEDVVARIGFVQEEERERVSALVSSGEVPTGSRGAEGSVLLALGRSLGPSGEVSVEALLLEIGHAERERLLSPREIFPRFFDQYGRLLLAQRGTPFGPPTGTHDLHPADVVDLAPSFLSALLSDQRSYLERRGERVALETLSDVLVAAAAALAGTAAAVLSTWDRGR